MPKRQACKNCGSLNLVDAELVGQEGLLCEDCDTLQSKTV